MVLAMRTWHAGSLVTAEFTAEATGGKLRSERVGTTCRLGTAESSMPTMAAAHVLGSALASRPTLAGADWRAGGCCAASALLLARAVLKTCSSTSSLEAKF
jgi:hypothetical protein